MNRNKEQELIDLFEEWIAFNDLDERNLFNKNKFAIVLKRELSLAGRWKDKKRGLPFSALAEGNAIAPEKEIDLNSALADKCAIAPENESILNGALASSNAIAPKKTNPFKYKYSEPYIYAEKSIGIIASKLPYRIKKHYEQEKKESGLELPKHFRDNLDEIIFNEKQDGKFILSQDDADFWSDLQVIKNKILEDLEKEESE